MAESCASVPEALFESEMFGHAAGAFTDAAADRPGRIAQADGGSLFLASLSDLPLSCQRKLVPVLGGRRLRPLGAEEELPIDPSALRTRYTATR